MRTATARRAARRARLALAIANYAVFALDVIAFAASLEARDAVAALAWLGSGTFWAWQAVTSNG